MNFKKLHFSSVSAAIVSLAFLTFSTTTLAQSVSLYDQPNPTAKVVGTADLSTGIIPIYTPPNNKDWLKIADPRNGNVGWIKSSDLKSTKGTENSVTFTQKIISTDKQPSTYQVMQFGPSGIQTKNMSNEQVKAFIQKMRIEQQTLQNSLQGVIKNMNDLIQNEWNMWNVEGSFPVIFVPANMKTQNDTQKINVTAPAPHTTNEAVKPSSTMGSEMEKPAIEKRPTPKEAAPITNTNVKP